MPENRRAFVVVIDALGVGALPDAHTYQDAPGANTLGNIDAHVSSLNLPNFQKLGVGNILPLQHVARTTSPAGRTGKMNEYSRGKDTTTGHWEMMGIYLEKPFRVYPDGFPRDVIDAFVRQTGCGEILANIPASGTEIIERYGARHLETGYPIVYTSADSVFQIAAHVDKVPLATLYGWCEAARHILQGEHEVSRVIARPFTGLPGAFERIGGDRRDYAVSPDTHNVMQTVKTAGGTVLAVGKIEDIFCQVGVTHAIHTRSNTHGLAVVSQIFDHSLDINPLILNTHLPQPAAEEPAFIFINLVDTDMKYGHRRDVQGYAHALEEIDAALGQWMQTMTNNDLLLITGDHGCDPTAPGSDHTREYVPIVMYSPALSGGDLGIRQSFADVGQTVLDWLGIPGPGLPGESLLKCSAEPLVAA